MRNRKQRFMKMAVVVAAIAIFVLCFIGPSTSPFRGSSLAALPTVESGSGTPDTLIDDLDKVIQQRFLTAPGFGRARIAPMHPTGPTPSHVGTFTPNTTDEFAIVSALEKEGLDVGIYLSGRTVTPLKKPKNGKDYEVRYRLFNPIPVTKGLKRSSFIKQIKLADEVKRSFYEFQDPSSPNVDGRTFTVGH